MRDWELWDTSTIAEKFKRTRKYVEEKIVSLPDFPAPVRLTGGSARPLWVASDVISWAESRRQAA
jgi:predicted DNA-binding transcriptional regulator AlpA